MKGPRGIPGGTLTGTAVPSVVDSGLPYMLAHDHIQKVFFMTDETICEALKNAGCVIRSISHFRGIYSGNL